MRHGRCGLWRPEAAGAAWRESRPSLVGRSRKMVRNRLGVTADFSYWQCYEGEAARPPDGPIAQLDRVTDFYSVGCRFESCWDRQLFQRDRYAALVKSAYHPEMQKTVWSRSGSRRRNDDRCVGCDTLPKARIT